MCGRGTRWILSTKQSCLIIVMIYCGIPVRHSHRRVMGTPSPFSPAGRTVGSCHDRACLRQAQQAQVLLEPTHRGSSQAGSACQKRGDQLLSSSLLLRPLHRTVPIYCHAPRPRSMTSVITAGRRWTGERGFLHSPSPVLATSGAACCAFCRRAHIPVNCAAAQCVLLQHIFTPCSNGFNPRTTLTTAMAQCVVATYSVPIFTVPGGLAA